MHPGPTPFAERNGSDLTAHARRAAIALSLFAAFAAPAQAQRAPAVRPALTELSLEQLMEVEVTTVSKHREKLTAAPAAIFALNADDLKRAAVLTLPDALRLVPGMQVGRVDAHNWAISARGFPDVFANKLLVLRDGRSIYTPLFSGVFWDAQDTVISDLERIEVVRGPGATLWGANAVNGVINILTKPAADTQGPLAAVTAGTDPHYSALARFGGAIDPSTHYRVYAKHSRYDNSPAFGGAGSVQDDWRLGQTGFRIDRQTSTGTILTLQGDAYRGREKEVYLLPAATAPFVGPTFSHTTFDGGNLLGRLTQRSGDGELMVQGYFDYTGRDIVIFGETRRTYDLETQYRFAAPNQEFTVGAGYRSTGDHVRNTPSITLTPARRRSDLWNAFAQDDIALGKAAHLVLGSKFEHNDFTGWEVQPGARLLFAPADAHTAWLSVARAVRTPSRAEDDVHIRQISSIPGVIADSTGSRSFESEQLTAFEAGYRFHVREKFSVDVATFVNRFRRLRTSELNPASVLRLLALTNPALSSLPPPPPFPFELFATAGNRMRGETYGGEIALAAQLAPGWRVRAAYSHLDIMLHREPGSTDVAGELDEGRSPRDQGYLWTQHDFSERWRFDGILRAVGALKTTRVPAYTTLDLRLAWRPNAQLEVSLNGRNLLDRRHPEALPATIITSPTETPRSAFMEIRYGF